MRPLLVPLFLASALAVSGCIVPGSWHGNGYGPPPHAPAHGYRMHHGDADLVYDTGLGVYVVVNRPGYFWSGDRFLHFDGRGWQMSPRLGGPWNVCSEASVPPGLRRAHPGKSGYANPRGKPRPKGYR